MTGHVGFFPTCPYCGFRFGTSASRSLLRSWCETSAACPPCRRAGAALPGRFAETLDSCRPGRQPRHFFCWEEFTLARARQGSDAGQVARPGSWGLAAIRKKKSVLQSSPHGRTGIFVTLVPPMSRKRGWASPFWASPYSLGEPSNEVGASHQTRLGEPSNEVGRASTKPLGEPVLSRWASHSTTPASKLRLGATVPRHVPARHCACSARLVKCQLGTCPLGAAPPRCQHRGANFPTSARSALCLLGTCPLGTFS